jgi:hypothetical protein
MRGSTILSRFSASNEPCHRVIDVGFLSDADLDVFRQLIRHRRSLPLYLGGFWGCCECQFESSDLVAMGAHIMGTHGPTIMRRLDHGPSVARPSSASRLRVHGPPAARAEGAGMASGLGCESVVLGSLRRRPVAARSERIAESPQSRPRLRRFFRAARTVNPRPPQLAQTLSNVQEAG